MRDVLQALATGKLTVEEAEQALKLYAISEIEGVARLDVGRGRRIGLPEIVRCRGKSANEAVALASAILDAADTVILSDAGSEHVRLLSQARPQATLRLEERAGLLVARRPSALPPPLAGSIAIVTAGTSDLPIALQVQVIAETLGARTRLYADAGIAGLHRIFPVVREIIERDDDVVVVIAGQEGALAPVLAGLVDLPIIGVPVSTGTGFGEKGIAALSTMLQSCSLGIAVVNIDNGIAAGAVAAAIARRAGRSKRVRSDNASADSRSAQR